MDIPICFMQAPIKDTEAKIRLPREGFGR